MKRYVAQRLILLLVTLLGVLTVTFVVSRLLPGSPLTALLGPKPTAEQVAQAREALGLDQPVWRQYLLYVGDVLKGDLGTSLRTRQPVIEDIGRRMTATLELVTLATLLAVGIGLPVGVASG